MDAASWDTGHSNSDTESEQQHEQRDQAIIDAARNGDVAAVRQWLDDGNDADARITVGPYIPGRDNWIFGGDGEGLLHHILRFHPNNFDDEVKRKRCDVPDPLAHLVCKFWLGEPPRRRRAAPATE